MFRVRHAEVLPESVIDAGKADGFIHICEQAALMFGSDRRKPTHHRPVVVVRREGPRIVVLPCTTKDNTASPDFFELDDKRVEWLRPSDNRSSFAYYRYEVISSNRLKDKAIGCMPQAARIELLNWLRARY